MVFLKKFYFYIVAFSLIFSLSASPEQQKPTYYLTIGTIFKNEAKWLKEWIEFHRLVGVEHFYLYNNLSDDHYLEVLTPYINKGIVTLIDWPYLINCSDQFTSIQVEAMKDCISKADSHWIALLDVDEFLFPSKLDKLKQFLMPFDHNNVGAIFVNWYMYGTSYVDEIPENKLLVETLTKRGEKPFCTGKLILKPRTVTNFLNIHYPYMLDGYIAIYPNFIVATDWFADDSNSDIIRINHYWSRDRKYFDEVKSKRGDISPHAGNQWFLNSFINETNNHTDDHEIHRYVPRLRRIMNLK